jgi:hypothetical protein
MFFCFLFGEKKRGDVWHAQESVRLKIMMAMLRSVAISKNWHAQESVRLNIMMAIRSVAISNRPRT